MYGIIDIGANSMRLSIYKFENNEIYPMLTKKITAGLAGYVNDAGYMTTKGIDKAVGYLNEFRKILRNVDVKDTYVFATASLRNIKNTEEAARIIESRTGLNIEVISGEEEATLDYVGASMKLNLENGLLIDIGGGSTELVFYMNGEIKSAQSLPVGSLNMHNKYVEDFLPTKNEMIKIERKVIKELEKAVKIGIPVNTRIICGVGGTVRATCKLMNEIYDLPESNRNIPVEDIGKIIEYYKEDRYDFITQIIKTIPDRLHTILPGMIILNTLATHFKSETINVSEFGVREGYLYKMIMSRIEEDVR
ncbi:phosphatase [Gudongella oleilytica]|uniref:Ppx/GppA phosphatase family protein n=1 Tax=Gudongella oleilytica TaxID=1582259 RepID=UPI000FF880A8|nr:phosphatase [Gudongella oleilytica]